MQARTAPSPSSAPPNSKRRRPTKKPQQQQQANFSNTSTPIDTPSMTPRSTSPVVGESSRGFTTERFTDFVPKGLISNITAQGIASLTPKHEFLTPVQSTTLPVILTGVDVLAQAKTGTGKTLAFLIPAIEQLFRINPKPRSSQISVLILSPTRELAIQIEEAARSLLSATNGAYGVQHTVGGTNMGTETKRMNSQPCDILVGTPGRLLDRLENTDLKSRLSSVRCLILDEADRLLEQGFKQEITKIINYLPDRRTTPRQTLLFSATIPQAVHQVASLALLPNSSFISTISEADANTHKHVPQHSLIATLNDLAPMTLAAIRAEIATHGTATKIMCFLPTARATALFAALFTRIGLPIEVSEIHSRKSQSSRNAAAEAFKVAKSGILFSSDVTARGMDFPGVTTVIQTGLPATAEQYIHRLGRTARAGNSGCGIIILAEWERFFLSKKEIAALPLAPHPDAETSLSLQSPALALARQECAKAMSTVSDEVKAQAYSASIGFYKTYVNACFGNADNLVKVWNDYAVSANGLAFNGASGELPGMLASTVGKMGLKGVRGLNIVHSLPAKENGGGGGGGGQRGGRGGGGGGRGGGGGGRGGGGGGRGGGGGGRGGGGGGGRGRGGRGGGGL